MLLKITDNEFEAFFPGHPLYGNDGEITGTVVANQQKLV
jgi:hypothetical protein